MYKYTPIFFLLTFSVAAFAQDNSSQRITEQLLDEHNPAIPLISALGEDAFQMAMDTGKYQYIGNTKCRLCHRDFFIGRKGDKHDHTFKRLADSAQQNAPQCLVCHSTGYGIKGGFISITKTPHLANVQCEGCHGPGSVHMLRNSAGGFLAGSDHPEILKRMCANCHTQRWNRSYTDLNKAYNGYKTAMPREQLQR